jgi:Enoyl-CoA hydratase/carnithine racemase
VRLWTLGDDGVGILSFKTKMNTVNDFVLDGVQHAIKLAEEKLKAVVIWQTGEPFSAGADLKGALGLLKEGKIADFEKMVENFQRTSMAIKYSLVPVVSAVRGMAFGGGCEFQMHSARTVAALESYIGLVEAGVGLLPAGGGLHELAVRAAKASPGDPFEEAEEGVRDRGDGQGFNQRDRSEEPGPAARQRRGRVQRLRTAVRSQEGGERAG